MMPPFVVFPTNRIAHFVEVSLYLFYLAQQVKLLNECNHNYAVALLNGITLGASGLPNMMNGKKNNINMEYRQ